MIEILQDFTYVRKDYRKGQKLKLSSFTKEQIQVLEAQGKIKAPKPKKTKATKNVKDKR